MEQTIFGTDLTEPVLALVLAAAAIMGSPGPSTMSVTAVGAAFGLRRSLRHLAGLVLGTLVVLLAVAAGTVTVLLSQPRLAPVLVAASAAYILYLAFRIATAPPLGARNAAAGAPSIGGGFLLGVANPKAYMALTAVFAGSALPVEPPLLEASLKTAILGIMVVLIHLVWLLAGTTLAGLLRDPLYSRAANLGFAAALVAATLVPLLA